MRWLTLFLALLIAALQYPLWLGKGSWLRVWEVDQKIAAQKQVNQGLKARNASLEAEVRDLKQGYDAIEERARSELGMVKQDEVFFQVLDNDRHPGPAANAAAKESAGKPVASMPKP
ncbi:MAG: cell division protein FtsB [Sulfurimicrobium sp.]|nr:cell division protein FtsB [Sulfurimicrobium sp.]